MGKAPGSFPDIPLLDQLKTVHGVWYFAAGHICQGLARAAAQGGGVLPADVPQMIVITFDDAVNDENWDLYQDKLFPPNLQESQWLPHP